MGNLSHIEKQKVERELRMGGGGVLNFSNRTFEEFFREVVGVQIYDSRYDRASGSKAHRMRAFWDVATTDQLRIVLHWTNRSVVSPLRFANDRIRAGDLPSDSAEVSW